MNCIHNLRVLFSLILNNFFMNLICVCIQLYYSHINFRIIKDHQYYFIDITLRIKIVKVS